MPKISVLLPVYNGEKYIREAIDSILNQTFSDFELIIIEDGSEDKTKIIVSQIIDPRIILIFNEKNIGIINSLNTGLSIAKGEFIARMDADDISHTSRFEKQVFFLDAHPDVGVLGTFMEQIDETGNILSIFEPPEDHDLIAWCMVFDCVVAHATIMARRTLLDDVGRYNPIFIHAEDTELWSRLIFITRFSNIPEVLYLRRLHKNSISNQFANVQLKQDILIHHKLLENILHNVVDEKDANAFFGAWSQRNTLNAKTVLLIEKIMQELFCNFKKNSLKSKQNIPQIRRDIVNRLFCLIPRSIGFLEIFSIIKFALKIDFFGTLNKIIHVTYQHKKKILMILIRR